MDSRDLQDRLEELENKKDLTEDEKYELEQIKELKEECEDYGWEYGIHFIPEDEFSDYAEELFDECYLDIASENIKYYIDYDKFADDIKMDYNTISFMGRDYYWRGA